MAPRSAATSGASVESLPASERSHGRSASLWAEPASWSIGLTLRNSSRASPTPTTAAQLTLTPVGRRRVDAATKTYEATVATLLDDVLSADEQGQMHGFVIRLLAAFERKE